MLKELKGYRKGVDLGGWLSQCDHTIDRYENFITEDDFKKLSTWGIDHVRVPVDYDLVENKDGSYKEDGFAYIQRAIDWCGKYNLNMVLDLHKTYGYSFDDGEQEAGFFDNEVFQERFYKLWEQFASRFAKYEDRVVFELLNEVTDKSYCDTWNRISTTCIKRIRAIAPTIRILIGGYWNNATEAVKDLAMPVDENIVYNFHCYDPLIYTHQGAFWVKGMPTDLRLPVNITLGEMADRAAKGGLTNDDVLRAITGSDTKIDAKYFIDRFAEAVSVAEERGVALYCGEYGVIDFGEPEDQITWYSAIHEAFEHYGIGRAAWSYKEMNFGLSDAYLDNYRDRLLANL